MLTRGSAVARAESGLRSVLRRAGEALQRAWWWARDYAYVVRAQAVGMAGRGGAEVYRDPTDPVSPAVVLVPGVYESWRFLRPLAGTLHRAGHSVHVLPTLGYNRGPIPAAAALLARYLAEQDLHDVVVVAHSKGGLIGKLAMLREDRDGRIRSMVAISTPFAGSVYARWVPLAAVRAFVPTDATLVALAAEQQVNARITSLYSRFDPHIPGGSVLTGATNVELSTPGHFRVLTDPRLAELVLGSLRSTDGPAVPCSRRPEPVRGRSAGRAAPASGRDAGSMTRFQTSIRVPAAIEASIAGPYVHQLLQDPTDGEVIEQHGDAVAGTVVIEFLAEDADAAVMHAQLLAERAPGCEVEDVRPA